LRLSDFASTYKKSTPPLIDRRAPCLWDVFDQPVARLLVDLAGLEKLRTVELRKVSTFEREPQVAKADFRTFYRDAHAVTCLTEREKMLMGLAVAMMRLCDP
jgi:hypothetical protein